MTLFRKMAAVLAAAIAFTSAASAQELKIGLKTEPSSLDPRWARLKELKLKN